MLICFLVDFKDQVAWEQSGTWKNKISIFKGLASSILTKIGTILHYEMFYMTIEEKEKFWILACFRAPKPPFSQSILVLTTATIDLNPPDS